MAPMRDSGIPKLGRIPAHWKVWRLRFLLDGIEQGWSPQCDNYPAGPEEWGVLKTGCVNGDRFDETENKRLPDDLHPRVAYEIHPGDFLMSRANTTALVGSAALVREVRPRLLLCDKLYRLRVDHRRLDPAFLEMFLNTPVGRYEFERDATGASGSMQNISQDAVRNLWIALPKLGIQRAIVDYLDAETARIDALIAAKEKLLTILAEKRRAVITQAVTRGLDPSVPMRESGVPWLGEIPAHWQVFRLKFLLDGIEQGWSPQCDNYPAEPDEWGVLKTGCVNSDTFDEDENKRLPDDLEPRPELEVRDWDFLMSRANTTSLVGSAAVVRTVRPRLMLCDKLYRLRVRDERLHRLFLELFFNSPVGRQEFERDASGASGSMQNISQESVRNIWLAVPPLDEQHRIIEATHALTRRLDQVRDAASRTMVLLRERREAIIAAAVTGQLDVEA